MIPKELRASRQVRPYWIRPPISGPRHRLDAARRQPVEARATNPFERKYHQSERPGDSTIVSRSPDNER